MSSKVVSREPGAVQKQKLASYSAEGGKEKIGYKIFVLCVASQRRTAACWTEN